MNCDSLFKLFTSWTYFIRYLYTYKVILLNNDSYSYQTYQNMYKWMIEEYET